MTRFVQDKGYEVAAEAFLTEDKVSFLIAPSIETPKFGLELSKAIHALREGSDRGTPGIALLQDYVSVSLFKDEIEILKGMDDKIKHIHLNRKFSTG